MTRPPTIGATTRFIMSAPVPSDHMIGISPMKAAATVIILGRILFTAPWMIASLSSSRVLIFPARTASW